MGSRGVTSEAVPTEVVGRNVEMRRKVRGFTREELAAIAGVNESTIFRIERGAVAPGARTLSRIAWALGVTVDSLLEDAS